MATFTDSYGYMAQVPLVVEWDIIEIIVIKLKCLSGNIVGLKHLTIMTKRNTNKNTTAAKERIKTSERE